MLPLTLPTGDLFISEEYVREQFEKLKRHKPVLINGRVFEVLPSDYEMNKISQYFSDKERLKCRVANFPTPEEVYYSREFQEEAIRLGIENDPYQLAEELWRRSKQCTSFKLTVVVGVCKLLKAKTFLDGSMGWGDRLIGAHAAGIERYVGFDPNSKMHPIYERINDFFKRIPETEFYKQPFEKADLSRLGSFDLFFTSPPFFKYENYTTEPGQSVVSYPTADVWLKKFLFVSLDKAFTALNLGGWMVVHMSNLGTLKLADAMVRFMKTRLRGGEYQGFWEVGTQKLHLVKRVTLFDFPLKRYFMGNPCSLFQNAKTYRPLIESKDGAFEKHGNIIPENSWKDFTNFFPLSFDGKIVIIQNRPQDYEKINILPDFFSEEIRIRDKGAFSATSPLEFWERNKEKIKKRVKDPTSAFELREELFRQFPHEVRQAKVTVTLALFDIFKPKRVLDPSAAYSARLIAALASESVVEYWGFDPYKELEKGWKEVIDCFLSKKNVIMRVAPFDKVALKFIPNNVDFVIVSPPPFVGDVYAEDSKKGQAKFEYPTFELYVNKFLRSYTRRAARALEPGGHLALTVLDRPGLNYQVTEKQLRITSEFLAYKGVIFFAGDKKGSLTPWWIFRK